MSNIVRARVAIEGTRTLVQHHFGPDSIPLEKGEKTGVAGNDPEEWKKTCLLTEDGQLYLLNTYVFGCLGNGGRNVKKGRGTYRDAVLSTLQVEEDVILLDRRKPVRLTQQSVLTPTDPSIDVFIYVSTVRNPATKGRNVRYRLATRPGWRCKFTIRWDKTIVPREVMKTILRDAGVLGGLGDGIKIGCGRFEVVRYVELEDGEQKAAPRSVAAEEGNGVGEGRKKMRPLRE